MKKLTFLASLAGFLFLPSCGGGNEQPTPATGDTVQTGEKDLPTNDNPFKRYGIESGMVEYEHSGSQKGKEILYFVDWGLKEARYTDTEMTVMGISNKTSTVSMIDGDWVYHYDRISKKGTKMKNVLLEGLTDAQKKDVAEVGMEMMKKMGAKKTGTEEVAGKTCDVWEATSMGTKIWIWENIVMKTTIKMAGVEYTTLAVKVEENADVEGKILFPDGVDRETFEDMSNVLDKVEKKK